MEEMSLSLKAKKIKAQQALMFSLTVKNAAVG